MATRARVAFSPCAAPAVAFLPRRSIPPARCAQVGKASRWRRSSRQPARWTRSTRSPRQRAVPPTSSRR
eukprot:2507452-Lingulodinium_polyedra.AAC.1